MKLLHFGFAVRDIERSTKAYRDLFGIVWDPIVSHVTALEGAPARVLVTHGYTSDGTEIEMVQQVEGASADSVALGEGREGISHIAFAVKDLRAERDRMAAAGVRIFAEGTASRADWFFVNHPDLGGAVVQLVQLHDQADATDVP